MKLHFVSLNKPWTEEIQKLFPGIPVTYGEVQKIPSSKTIFVSPANSLGFMDGGIDYALSREMFPGLQTKVQRKIKELGLCTGLGRHYLPIGQALTIDLGDSAVVVAPTMFLPHDVSDTQNAYWSFLAALAAAKKTHPDWTLVVTSHCCGYGKMAPTESAKQMRLAWEHFSCGKLPEDSSKLKEWVGFPAHDDDQPDNFDNREIKEHKIITLQTSSPMSR
jgi:O-acetyl-ADP-ribose deacetylase (regulator of RNase III)